MASNARCFSSLRSILQSKAACLQTQNRPYFKGAYSIIFSDNRKRRLKRGESGNKTRYGPLTDLPDFTYLDGRPTPLTAGQKERKEERIKTAERIMKLVGEMETAQVMYDTRIQREENELKQRQNKALRAKVH
ncbi:hypothetical protein LOTGIDRAFT_236847 [Lottia gigantea]|uniref:Large ribosomal subunit protein mL52 n=1 Tax=Lottia gigantea TaxID=225164 RepID=V3ZG08_LOTGI|nr:hypothetical protein LOTGIDRAFT_236847 [Lottia gigantea]ESO83072.1 hypothetical protein LOTGIDRAFT_236847 [Lottia gigantea]